MSLPNMNILPYIGDESGSQLVPEPSRLIGSARSTEDRIDICICDMSCGSCPCIGCMGCGRLRSIAPTCALVLIASTIALIRIKIRFCCMLLVCFCSGSRVGCGDLCKYRRHACRYSRRFEIADRGLVRPTKAERERE